MPKGIKGFQKGKNNPNWIDGRCDDIKGYIKKYQQEHKKELKEYNQEHREKIREYKRKYIRERRKDSQFRLDKNVGTAIWFALKNKKAGRHWEALVGYTLEKLMQRLSVNFKKGMSFQNYGEWHIDHKKPQSLFNYENAEEQAFKDCWSLVNLQPLWAIDNLRKYNNYIKI